MRRYNIVVGKPDIFVCHHAHAPHDGPCERSTFVHGDPADTVATIGDVLPTALPVETTSGETLP